MVRRREPRRRLRSWRVRIPVGKGRDRDGIGNRGIILPLVLG